MIVRPEDRILQKNFVLLYDVSALHYRIYNSTSSGYWAQTQLHPYCAVKIQCDFSHTNNGFWKITHEERNEDTTNVDLIKEKGEILHTNHWMTKLEWHSMFNGLQPGNSCSHWLTIRTSLSDVAYFLQHESKQLPRSTDLFGSLQKNYLSRLDLCMYM